MSGFNAEKLYQLLPAIHRIRDAEQGGPLKALLAVISEQLEVIEENIEQLYDDQFIETCADWAIPYIGDLIGYRTLYGDSLGVGSPRAEVAHTIALRRRKGTAAVLEQLARDVTGWNARAVEFFQTLATTQYMNHLRPYNHYAPDLRQWEPLEQINTAFDTVAHTVDVRRIASGRGRYNVPNVGLFLWPIESHRLTRSTAVRVDDLRWRISALNHDMPLYNRPEAEERITHMAEPYNVPMQLSRRRLHEDLLSPVSQYYGEGWSLALYINDSAAPVPVTDVVICNLSGDDPSWAHVPVADGKFAIDPVLGRVALPENPPEAVEQVHVTHHYGFGAEISGGEYERTASFAGSPTQQVARVPDDHATIAAALAALAGDGVVEITDNGRYEEAPSVQVAPGGRIELRARNERRPSLVLTDEMTVNGGVDSEFSLNGLLISGEKLRVAAAGANQLRHLRIAHSTLVPGWALTSDGAPAHPDEPSLIIETPDTEVRIERAIVGGLRTHSGASLALMDSIVDATSIEGVASAGLDGMAPGASLSMQGCTSIGKLHAAAMPLISDSLLLAALAENDTWEVPVRAERKQTGCVRFSWLPLEARVPRRYRCQPRVGAPIAPRILSLRYGTPIYCWLSARTSDAIRRGAEDEGEMGVFHHLRASQRETNLRVRLAEYLRAGLESGIFYEV